MRCFHCLRILESVRRNTDHPELSQDEYLRDGVDLSCRFTRSCVVEGRVRSFTRSCVVEGRVRSFTHSCVVEGRVRTRKITHSCVVEGRVRS